ncbi:hypothetical protein NYR79_08610 [Actinobacillus equuli subsp. haemolyticus]|uniref:hypothetical protein n=1 Tax=Actinobacillus equuli TaxID=718 RepID=UPI002442AEF3|nr:hypothetical protein [Actinobacillus equuli]WGE70905.1 hypothetical protein NYR79_08610 [Actinobacillus equuli subsp. haemolyticus]
MRDEFNNRIKAQRKILKMINKYHWNEEIYGLSEKAISRWIRNNTVNEEIITLLYDISDNLFFLGTKSQEQITQEYQTLSSNISDMEDKLEKSLKYLYSNILIR